LSFVAGLILTCPQWPMWLRSFAAALPSVHRAHTDQQVPAWFRDTVLPTHEAWMATVEDSVVGMMVLHGGELGQLYLDPPGEAAASATASSNWRRSAAQRGWRCGHSRSTGQRNGFMNGMASSRSNGPMGAATKNTSQTSDSSGDLRTEYAQDRSCHAWQEASSCAFVLLRCAFMLDRAVAGR
jgi:hypothetical protein